MASHHRRDPAPGADPGPQQDPGRPALWRVQELLPRQRGGILRQLLRLLPARSLRPAHRHLHREGQLDQRADRPHAPLGHAGDPGAGRRDHRRLGLLHLRHRLGGDLHRHDLLAGDRRGGGRAAADGRPGGPAIQAQRRRLRARQLPPARRRDRDLPRPLRGPRLARLPLRRGGGVDHRVRPPHRQEDRRSAQREDLRQQPLRHPAPDPETGHRPHQGGDGRAPEMVHRDRQAARSPAPGATHPLRPGDDGDHRLLRRHRELQPLPHRPPAGRAAAHPVRVRARKRPPLHRREPPDGSADRRHVQGRLPPQDHPGRIRLPPALLHGQPAPQVRGVGGHAAADGARLRHPRPVGAGQGRRRLRRTGDPPHRPDRPARGGAPGLQGRRLARSTTSSPR